MQNAAQFLLVRIATLTQQYREKVGKFDVPSRKSEQ